MRVLIAEDKATAARDLATTVEALGHAVTGLVDSGEAALTAAAQQHPDLVLMDLHLAGLVDSVTAAQQLQTQLHIPVIYLTAHADAAGGGAPAGYLLRPFDERVLGRTLDLVEQQQLQRQLQASEARFTTALGSIGDAVLVTDLAGMVTTANAAAAQLCGHDAQALVGRALTAVVPLVHAETYAPLPDLIAQVLATDTPIALAAPTLLLAPDGQIWPIKGSAAPIRDDAGQPTGVVLVFREIRAYQAAAAAQRQAEESLRDANARLAASLAALERQAAELRVLGELGGALMRCTSLEDGYVIVTRAAQRLFSDVAGTLFVQRHDRSALEPVLAWGLARPPFPSLRPSDCRALGAGQILLGEPSCDGCCCADVPAELSRAALCVPLVVEGEALGVLHVHLPLTEPAEVGRAAHEQLAVAFAEQAALGLANVRLRALLREQAIRDPLTGLFNRRYLEETLSRELHRAARDHYPVGVIMLDVDHFKRINDSYGHDAGDIVLRAVSRLLLATVRASDVVCRYGGEEFVLMLPAVPLDVVAARAEAIRAVVAALAISHHGQALPPVTVSLGATIVTDAQGRFEDALARADAALYQAKHAGRDRVVVMAPGTASAA
ncbi:MAG: diguanylate cyclase [Chloroflexales bacterium]|nr:diguanylate cyclase [Chloroflexales bacterium]